MPSSATALASNLGEECPCRIVGVGQSLQAAGYLEIVNRESTDRELLKAGPSH
jgi:hypothetical protein